MSNQRKLHHSHTTSPSHLTSILSAYESGDLEENLFIHTISIILQKNPDTTQSLTDILHNFSGKPACKAYHRLASGELTLPPNEIQRSAERHRSLSLPNVVNGSDSLCPICKESSDKVVCLDCGHSYCSSCISSWLNLNHTCPLCRYSLPTKDSDFFKKCGLHKEAYQAELQELDQRKDTLNIAIDAIKDLIEDEDNLSSTDEDINKPGIFYPPTINTSHLVIDVPSINDETSPKSSKVSSPLSSPIRFPSFPSNKLGGQRTSPNNRNTNGMMNHELSINGIKRY
jgi:Zinc finger, C3HC4 type (RING finger)